MTVLAQDRKLYINLTHFERDKLKADWEAWEKNYPLCNEAMFGKEEGKQKRMEEIIELITK